MHQQTDWQSIDRSIGQMTRWLHNYTDRHTETKMTYVRHLRVCMYVRTYVRTYVHTCMHIYTHIHTYRQIHRLIANITKHITDKIRG